MELKVYQLTISENENDDSEVNFVALVDYPAIQRNFLKFRDKQMFAINDEDQHIVSGPAMIPDELIYRRDLTGEYYVLFTADTIQKIAYRFFKKGYQSNINLMHDSGAIVSDSVFFESWLVDRSKGKNPMAGFEDLPDGTWFLTAKINNPETWQKIKAGEVKGFSVEGLFEYSVDAELSPEEKALREIMEVLKDLK